MIILRMRALKDARDEYEDQSHHGDQSHSYTNLVNRFGECVQPHKKQSVKITFEENNS